VGVLATSVTVPTVDRTGDFRQYLIHARLPPVADACIYHEQVDTAPAEQGAGSSPSTDAGHAAHAAHGVAAVPGAEEGQPPAAGHAHHGGAAGENASGLPCDCGCLLLCVANAHAVGPAPAAVGSAPVAMPAPARASVTHVRASAPSASLIAHFLPPAIAPPAS
jgi:hypothetical protein